MKRNFLPLILITLILISCGKDEIEVLLNTSGTTTLTFSNGEIALANAEVRVSSSPSSSFQVGNVFEGETNEDGNIKIGPLNTGTYYFRIDLGDLGYLVESFEIVSGTSSQKTFNIQEFTSNAEFEILNADQNFNFSTFDYYLVPVFLTVTGENNEQVLANSISGNVSSGKIAFNNVLTGIYDLYAFANNELVRIGSLSGYFIQRDFDFASSVTIPGSLVLIAEDWTISNTIEIFSGVTVSNAIRSVSFDSNECTFTFSDNSTYSTLYFASIFSDGSISISLNSGNVNRTDVDFIYNVDYTTDGVLEVEYYDNTFEDFRANFN